VPIRVQAYRRSPLESAPHDSMTQSSAISIFSASSALAVWVLVQAMGIDLAMART
jgi:hypothetical protein